MPDLGALLNPHTLRAAKALARGDYLGAVMHGLAIVAQSPPARQAAATAQALGTVAAGHLAGDREAFLRAFVSQNSGVYAILGQRGSGKTALAFALAELRGRPMVAVGIPAELLPPHITALPPDKLDDAPHGHTVVIDDANLVASSRNYRSKRAADVDLLVTLARHRELGVISTSVDTGSLNRRLLDVDALFLKPTGILGEALAREGLQQLVRTANDLLGRAVPSGDDLRSWVMVASPQYVGLLRYELPAWYGDRISRNKR